MRIKTTPVLALLLMSPFIQAQTPHTSTATPKSPRPARPEDTEFYTPVPAVVVPGKSAGAAPSDAIVLFSGQSLDSWVSTSAPGEPAKWEVGKDYFTVKKGTGNIQTKQRFGNYQLHIEWKIPENITGTGQARGNSGIFLASTGPGDAGYELQVLDSYQNKTYVNGMAGSIYKQLVPLVNPAKKPGEWQTYDVVWTAPVFKDPAPGVSSPGVDTTIQSPARVTVFFNGVLVQNNGILKGETRYIGAPGYKRHGRSPIKLQAHGDKSEPISYRNIWVREL